MKTAIFYLVMCHENVGLKPQPLTREKFSVFSSRNAPQMLFFQCSREKEETRYEKDYLGYGPSTAILTDQVIGNILHYVCLFYEKWHATHRYTQPVVFRWSKFTHSYNHGKVFGAPKCVFGLLLIHLTLGLEYIFSYSSYSNVQSPSILDEHSCLLVQFFPSSDHEASI